MYKSIFEYLNSIDDEIIRYKAIINCPNSQMTKTVKSLEFAILSAFSWEKSPEGHRYWSSICIKAKTNQLKTNKQQ